jgi:hypothetical protein
MTPAPAGAIKNIKNAVASNAAAENTVIISEKSKHFLLPTK